MAVFVQDTSTQLTTLITTSTPFYTSQTIPTINFNNSSGIYNPSANTVKIFTNNTDALTIDSNQCLYGNGTGITHLQYTHIDNTSNLSVYATNIDVNNLSTNSMLSINNLNTTSTTICNNLNSLSSNSFSNNYTNLNNLNVSGVTKLNGNTTCISNLNVSGMTILNSILSLPSNLWHQSNDGLVKTFYNYHGTSFFHSGNANGEGYIFRNAAQSDILTI